MTLTGILEKLQLHLNKREALAKTVGHKYLLLLEYLCYLNNALSAGGEKRIKKGGKSCAFTSIAINSLDPTSNLEHPNPEDILYLISCPKNHEMKQKLENIRKESTRFPTTGVQWFLSLHVWMPCSSNRPQRLGNDAVPSSPVPRTWAILA